MINQQLRHLIGSNKMFHLTPEVSDDASLFDSGVIDSFGMIGLVISLEQQFGIAVPPEEATAERFRSIASIAAYIETKQNAHHRG